MNNPSAKKKQIVPMLAPPEIDGEAFRDRILLSGLTFFFFFSAEQLSP
jgi:hypothetical protein